MLKKIAFAAFIAVMIVAVIAAVLWYIEPKPINRINTTSVTSVKG